MTFCLLLRPSGTQECARERERPSGAHLTRSGRVRIRIRVRTYVSVSSLEFRIDTLPVPSLGLR
jgi:hypothetical protein